jgi:tight adherence protein C
MQINNDPTLTAFILGAISIGVIGIVVLILGIARILKTRNKVSSRLVHYVAEGKTSPIENKPKKVIIPRDISGSLINRLLPPVFNKVSNFLTQLTPATQLAKLDHDLGIAGNPGGMKAGGFLGVQLLLLVLGVLFAFFWFTSQTVSDLLGILLGLLLVVIPPFLPRTWLSGRVRSVQNEIRRALPEALDMLSVCASAGLGFDQSLQKISTYWKSKLSEELSRTIYEMEMGISRSNALQSLADRLSVEELSSFITIIIQAEKMGMSYAEVLHSQAEQMRVLRLYRAREIANMLPAKMIVPLALLIFPALIAVILGPAIPTLFSMFR